MYVHTYLAFIYVDFDPADFDLFFFFFDNMYVVLLSVETGA